MIFQKISQVNHYSPQKNTQGNEPAEKENGAGSVVFLEKLVQRFVEGNDVIQIIFFSALPFVMNNLCGGHIINFKAVFVDAMAQIDVLAVHKETFVEQTDFIKNFFANHHKRAGNAGDGVNFVGIQIR